MSKHLKTQSKDSERQLTPMAIRPADVQRLTGLSAPHIARLIASGELKSFKSGRARLIPLNALQAWIERKSA